MTLDPDTAKTDLELSLVEDFNSWRESVGLTPIKKRKVSNKKIRSISVSDEAYEGLKFLAGQHKALYGDIISVSALIEAIGVFSLAVVDPKELE